MLSWMKSMQLRESSLTPVSLTIDDCARQYNRLPGIKPGPCYHM
jgi:hypothetical protein